MPSMTLVQYREQIQGFLLGRLGMTTYQSEQALTATQVDRLHLHHQGTPVDQAARWTFDRWLELELAKGDPG